MEWREIQGFDNFWVCTPAFFLHVNQWTENEQPAHYVRWLLDLPEQVVVPATGYRYQVKKKFRFVFLIVKCFFTPTSL